MIRGSAAFLIAMLWMDLIFDTQVLRHRRADELPEPMLASIAGYYHRATTTSRPMSLLIVLTMPILLGTLGFREFHRADHLVRLLLMSSFLAVWVVTAA